MLHPQEVSTAGWSAHTLGVSAFVPQSIVLVQVTVHSSKMGWGGGLRHHTCAWGLLCHNETSLYSWSDGAWSGLNGTPTPAAPQR